jgi:hypothetical protein
MTEESEKIEFVVETMNVADGRRLLSRSTANQLHLDENGEYYRAVEYRVPYSTGGSEVIFMTRWYVNEHLMLPRWGIRFGLRPVTKRVYDTRRKVFIIFLDATINKPRPQPHRKPISNRERKIQEAIAFIKALAEMVHYRTREITESSLAFSRVMLKVHQEQELFKKHQRLLTYEPSGAVT